MKTALKADHQVAKTAEEIAAEIKKIANAMKALKDSKLNEKAIVILVAEASGLARNDVRKMLDTLGTLDTFFIKKAKT